MLPCSTSQHCARWTHLSGGSLQRHGKKFVPWPLGHLKESWKLNGPELSMRSDAQVRKATLGDAPAEGRVSE
jgi:hypothetical protein